MLQGTSIWALLITSTSLLISGCSKKHQVVWHLDNLQEIGGNRITVEGNPKVIDTPHGKAIEFDGLDDGIFLDVHPIAGLSEFTVEVIFNPYSGGAPEQRFFHMQENDSENRVMFETRLVENELWYIDTFIKSGEQNVPMLAKDDTHKIGPWYHGAIVVQANTFTHFVNGQKEMSEPLEYSAQGEGRTSLGVRLNKVHWFKGAIRTVRFTEGALEPREFLTVED